MNTLLPTEPSTNKALLKYSLALYSASLSRVLILSFLLALTAFLPRLVTLFLGDDTLLNLPPFSLHRLWFIAIELITLTFFVGILWRMHCLSAKKQETLLDDIKTGLKKSVLIFIATIIETLIVFMVCMLIYGTQILSDQYHLLYLSNPISILFICIVFLIQIFLIVYVSTLLIFIVPIIATENKGILFAFERSIYLSWNHWWRIFSLQLTPWLSYVVALIVLRGLGVNLHVYLLAHPTHNLSSVLINLVFFAFFIPWVAALILVQLKDLELRKQILVP